MNVEIWMTLKKKGFIIEYILDYTWSHRRVRFCKTYIYASRCEEIERLFKTIDDGVYGAFFLSLSCMYSTLGGSASNLRMHRLAATSKLKFNLDINR